MHLHSGGGVSESGITAFSETAEGATEKTITADDFKTTGDTAVYNGRVSGIYTITPPDGYWIDIEDGQTFSYYTDEKCSEEPVVPKDVGVYYAKIPVKDHPELDIVKRFEIIQDPVTKDSFRFMFKGQVITDSITVIAGEDSLEDLDVCYVNLNVDFPKEVTLDDFTTEICDESGNKVLLPTKPGTYHYKAKVKFKGTKNLTKNDELAVWDYTYIVKADAADFKVSATMNADMVYDGTTSYKPELDYDKDKYSNVDVKFEYYTIYFNTETGTHEDLEVENPIEGGTYYIRAIVNGETLEDEGYWHFNILPGEFNVANFRAELDGKAFTKADVPELKVDESGFETIYSRLVITYDGQPDVDLKKFDTVLYTEDGQTKIDLRNPSPDYVIQDDEGYRLKPGNYLVKLYFEGSKNLIGQQTDESDNYQDDPLYTVKLVLTSDPVTELNPDIDGLTKNEDGGYTLKSGYTLALGEDSDPVTEPLNNKGVVESGKFAEKVTGGEITGGTFANVENAEEITGGIFAQNPEECLAAGKTLTESVDQLKVVDINGAGLNDSCTVNDVIGAEENGIAVMALFAENSIEATPAAYIVGSGQKITLKNADASRTVKQWVVDFGNGTTETYNGNTAAFTVDAAGNTVTVTVVFEGQTLPTPVDPKPVDPNPTIPEVKEYTITVEDGKINGEPFVTVKAGDTVNLTVGEVPENMAFLYWDIPSDLLNALIKKDGNFSNKTQNLRFEMPELEDAAGKSFTISAAFGTAETAESDDYTALGVATGVVVGGATVAVAGWQLYNLGTELYLKAVLPQGASIPTNRQELALLLWQDAGKPEAVTALYADIAADQTDAQKAARWAIANGLMDSADEDSSSFAPNKSVSRFAIIKAWNQAQKMK